MRLSLVWLLCVAVLKINTIADAAEFKWQAAPEDQYETEGTVFVDGLIELGDHEKLLKAIGDNVGQKGIPLFLELNSDGGNFEEAIQISQVMQEKNLSTKLTPNAKCLSACAIIFMSGRSFNNSGFTKSRVMHPTAILGFHSPHVSAQGGGNFDSADLDNAYSRAIEDIGKKLMAVARYRDEFWSNPMIKPGLINEMMIKNGNNFYLIDTVGKAAELEIDLYDAIGPSEQSPANRANACANVIAAVADAAVADDAREWLVGDDKRTTDQESKKTKYSFVRNRAKGRFCDVTLGSKEVGDEDSEIVVGVGSAEQRQYVPDWFFWPSDKKLSSLPNK